MKITFFAFNQSTFIIYKGRIKKKKVKSQSFYRLSTIFSLLFKSPHMLSYNTFKKITLS